AAVVLGPAEILHTPAALDVGNLDPVDLPRTLEVVRVHVAVLVVYRHVPFRSRPVEVHRGSVRRVSVGALLLRPLPPRLGRRDARRGEPPARHDEVQTQPPPVLRRL